MAGNPKGNFKKSEQGLRFPPIFILFFITVMLLYSCSEGRWVGGNSKHFQQRHDYKVRMDSIKLAKN